MNFTVFIAIFIGGGLGAISRYTINRFTEIIDFDFPLGTLIVNLIGSFLFGLLSTYLISHHAKMIVKSFLLIGFLGSFTTFSTFTQDAYQLILEGRWFIAALFMTVNMLLGLLLLFLGVKIG